MKNFPQSAWNKNLTPAAFIILASASFVIFAIIIYWVIFLNTQRTLYAQTEQQAWVRVRQISNAVSVQVQTLFTGLNYGMLNIKNNYELEDKAAFDRAVNSTIQHYPEGSIIQISIADPEGKLIYSNLQKNNDNSKPVYITDREHFQVHLHKKLNLYISQPVKGRVSKKWTIQLTKPLYRNQKFIGVLVLSLSPTYISQYFQNIFDNPVDVILLAREDGKYLARSQFQDDVLGKSLPQERIVLFQSNANSGTYQATTGPDQLLRMYAWKRIDGFPLIISSGLEKQHTFEALEQAYHRNFIYNLIGTLLLLIIVVISAWLALQRQRSLSLLVQQKRHFMYLAEEVPGGLFQVTIQSNGFVSFPFTNPSFFKLHGIQPFSEQDFRLNKLTRCIHRDDLNELSHAIREGLQQKTGWDLKYRVIHEDGSVHWLRNHAKVQTEEDQSILWHGYVLDITQDEILQNTLRQQEEYLRLTFLAVQDGLWQWDHSNNQLVCDQRCYEILGYEHNSFKLFYKGFRTHILHPKDRKKFIQSLYEHIKHDHEFRVEVRFRTIDNAWRWVEIRGKVSERNSNFLPTKMLGTCTDIQKRVEHSQLVKAVLDRSNSLIFVTSAQHEILYANERAASIFRLPSGEQKTPIKFFHQQRSEQNYQKLTQLFHTVQHTGSVRTEWQLYTHNAQLNWFDIQGALLDPSNHSGNAIWTLNDINARHQAETELAQAQQRLEALVERFPSGILVVDTGTGEQQRIVTANKMLISTLQLDLSLHELIELPTYKLEKIIYHAIGFNLNLNQDEMTENSKKTIILHNNQYLEIEYLSLLSEDKKIGKCWIFQDITPQKEREFQLETLASTDALTGILNRRAFLNRLNVEISNIQQQDINSSALIMIDIDHFKNVNDTYGHAVGDLVLKHLVKVLSSHLQHNDILGRLGGEEFLILLPNRSISQAYEQAEMLRETISTTPAVVANFGMIHFTVSLGIYILNHTEVSIENCLTRVDSALYFSKNHGRNRSTLWQEAMQKNKQ